MNQSNVVGVRSLDVNHVLKKVIFRNCERTDGDSETVYVHYHRLKEGYRSRLIYGKQTRVNPTEVSKGVKETSKVVLCQR